MSRNHGHFILKFLYNNLHKIDAVSSARSAAHNEDDYKTTKPSRCDNVLMITGFLLFGMSG